MLLLVGKLGSMQGMTGSMKSKLSEAVSSVLKASGMDEQALWQKAKEHEKKHT